MFLFLDGHMAGLLATAKILLQDIPNMHGSVKLVFQPAEEGYGGATEMIADGVLEDANLGPRVDEIYGLHIWSCKFSITMIIIICAYHTITIVTAVGEVLCSDGPVMAATDVIEINVTGKGGHGAVPHQAVDAIVTACSLVTSMQTIISRNTDPLEAGVITCGMINGGYAHNIIADSVKIKGTARSFTPAVQDTIKTRLGQMCCGMAQCYGGSIDLNYKCLFL